MLTWEETRLLLTTGIAETYRRSGEPFTVCRCGWPTRSPAGVCGVCVAAVRESSEPEDRFTR
jgi:hypothetical protein